MVRYCAVILGCLAIGEIFVALTNIKIPSSMIGMLVLVLGLKLGWIKLHWVKGISDLLIANLGVFFVPPSIKIMLYYDVIKQNIIPIVVSMFISTILVIYSTGVTYQLLKNKKKNETSNK